MFSLAWLVGWLLSLRAMLSARVEKEIRDHTGDDGTVDLVKLTLVLYLWVRVFSYLAWFGQVSFLRAQARAHGTELPFTPSMPGVPPNFVDDVLRVQLRLDDGVLKSPVSEAAGRVSKKLGTWIDETARQTSVSASGMDDPEKMKASHRYAQEHGNPVARWVADVREVRGEVAETIAEDEELGQVVNETIDDYVDEFSQPLEQYTDDEDTDDDDELARELAQIEAEAEAEHEEKMRATVREAEIFLGLRDKHGRRFPIGWARVPTGATTCAFCLLLCARGAKYRSSTVIHAVDRVKKRGKAPMLGTYSPNAFHWHCDCIGVPVYADKNYDGRTQVEGAKKVYEDFKKWMEDENPGIGLTPSLYAEWLRSDKGRASTKKHVPTIRLVRK